ncbi:MAG: hypothetical protein M5U09_27515 [Gammaproteobacteria bacterium]|nr:hypothetical protein [Gammaproteobacteria bacterium]
MLDMFVSPAHAIPLPLACNATSRLQISIENDRADVCVSGPGFAHPGTTGVNTATGALNDIINIDNSGVDLVNMMVFRDPDFVTGRFSCDNSIFNAPLVPGTFDCSPEPFSNTTSILHLSSPYDETV